MGLCSLPVSCLALGNPVLESMGFYSMAIGDLQEGLCWDTGPRTDTVSASICKAGHCQSMPLKDTLKHSQLGLAQSPWEPLLLSYGPWSTQDYVCALQKFLYPPVLWRLCNQIQLTFEIRFPGDFQSLGWIPKLGSLMWGLEPLKQCEKMVLLFSSLWVTYPACIGFAFIIIVSLVPFCCGFSIVLGYRLSLFFFWLVPVYSYRSFGALAGEDKYMFFYSVILIWSFLFYYFFFFFF